METLFDQINPKITETILNEDMKYRMSSNEPVTIVHVPVASIVDHPDNHLIYLEIEDAQSFQNLKQDIFENGIIHIPVCKKSGGDFVLVDGHRRLAVIRALIHEGHTQFDSIDIKLIRFSSEIDELDYMLAANVKVRKPSDYSRMMQIAAYSKIYDDRRKNNFIKKEMSRSNFIAQHMLMSERQVNKFLYIHNRFSKDEIKELLTDPSNTINRFYASLKAKGDEYELHYENKPGVRLPSPQRKEKTFHLTVKEKQFLNKFVSDLSKVEYKNEQLLIVLYSQKELSNQLKRFSKSLSKTIETIHALCHTEES